MEIQESEYAELKAGSDKFKAMQKALKDRGFDTIDSLILDRDNHAVEHDKVKADLEKAGNVIARQGTDLGNARKEVERLKSKVNEEGRSEIPQVVTPDDPQKIESDAKELEGKLSEEQWEAVDAFYKQLPDDEAIAVAGDPKARKELYAEVLKQKPSRPESLRETIKQGNKPPEQQIRNKFSKFLEQMSYSPAGPGPRVPRGANRTRPTVMEDSRTS
ncbi:MAG: hypothetical protein EOM12_03365 [Verrucomicrobiae bacterium]|nr:hypothetical protein [Verrucomicrobiae bacterium]